MAGICVSSGRLGSGGNFSNSPGTFICKYELLNWVGTY